MSDFDMTDVASGLASVTGGLDDISKMQDRSQLFAEHTEDRAKKKQNEADVNTNMGMMSSPLQAHQQPTAMVGSPTSQVEARRRTAVDTQAKDSIRASKDNEEYKAKANSIIQHRLANKDESWEDMPVGLYSGRNGNRAYADLIQQEAQTVENRTRIMEGRAAKARESFIKYNQARGYINAALKAEDFQKAVNGIQQMTKDLPLPYQLGDFDPKSKTFSVQYLDSNSGKFQETYRIGFQEVMAQINQTGEKQFVTQMANNFEVIQKANVKKRQNPMYGKRADGQRFLVIPQKDVLNPNQVQIEVRDEKTNEKQMFGSWAELQEAGINVENLGREKAMGDQALNTQKIATSKASMENHNRANQDGGTKQLDVYKKQFNAYLAPFSSDGNSSGLTEGPDGKVTLDSAGKNAFKASQKFLYEHQEDYKSLTGQDKLNFAAAQKADKLYRYMLNGFKQQEQPAGDPAPENPAPENSKPTGPTMTAAEVKEKGGKTLPDGRVVIPSDIPGKAMVVTIVAGDPGSRTQYTPRIGEQTPATADPQGTVGAPWENTMLGKAESAVKNFPQNYKAADEANQEAFDRMSPKAMGGSSIPGMNTFKRQP